MLLGWMRPDHSRAIDKVIDYFGDSRKTRAAKTRRASRRGGATCAIGVNVISSRMIGSFLAWWLIY